MLRRRYLDQRADGAFRPDKRSRVSLLRFYYKNRKSFPSRKQSVSCNRFHEDNVGFSISFSNSAILCEAVNFSSMHRVHFLKLCPRLFLMRDVCAVLRSFIDFRDLSKLSSVRLGPKLDMRNRAYVVSPMYY